MLEYLLTIVSIALILVLPGISLSHVFGLKFDNFLERVFYSLSLSFAFAAAVGLGLSSTIGINAVTVLVCYLVASAIAIRSIIRKVRILLLQHLNLRQRTLDSAKRVHIGILLGSVVAVAVTVFNWYTAIGSHALDMGEHVYWAKTIMATGRVPNYYSVEPLDQAVKFTYGAHLLLAQFFLLTGLPIEEYTWILTLVGSIGIFAGVVLIALRISGSTVAAVLASILYGSAYQPFGYLERGNLPDISGYLLIIATLYSVLRVRKTPSYSYGLGLTAASVIPYHQLATVILPPVLGFTVLFSYLRSRSELKETLDAIFGGRNQRMFWTMMIVLMSIYALTSTYFSSNAGSQLITGNWRLYVPAPYDEPLVPGAALGLLGIAGIIVGSKRKTLGFMLLLGWVTALVFLTNGIIVGIPIPDPLRFLWRMTEPFAILGGIFGYLVVNRLGKSSALDLKSGLSLIRQNKMSLVGVGLLLVIISVQIGGLASPSLEGTPSVLSLPPRYNPVEAFYQDDKKIGQWLAANGTLSPVTTNDADADPTATWIQVYSMKLHFLYRADFAAIVAPTGYIDIYRNIEILYENPSDFRVSSIIHQYNITYVVAHTYEIPLFSAAPCFGGAPVFRSGSSALFATSC